MGQTIINGGEGPKIGALVDEEHRLYTRSNIITHPQHHSLTHENLFIVSACVTLTGTTETPLSHFKNVDSDIDFEIYLTQFNADADVQFDFRFDDEYSSGGTAVTPRNLHRGSRVLLPATRAPVYEGGTAADLTLDTTNGFNWHTVYTEARQTYAVDFQGGLIMANGSSLGVNVTGAIGDKACIIMMCSWHDAGAKL